MGKWLPETYLPNGPNIQPNKVRPCDCGCHNLEIDYIQDPIRGSELWAVKCPLCRATGRYSSQGTDKAIKYWNDRTERLPLAGEVPTNQCDGCVTKMPLIKGVHYHNGHPYMVCTKERYPEE